MSLAQSTATSTLATADQNAISALLAELDIPVANVAKPAKEPKSYDADSGEASVSTAQAAMSDFFLTADNEPTDDLSIETVLAELDAKAAMIASDAPADAPVKPARKARAPKVKANVEGNDTEPAPAKQKLERVHFSNKVDRIKHRLGDELGDYMVLEISDAELGEAKLAEKQSETLFILELMNVKEKNRASSLFEFMSEKKPTLNPVIDIAFRTLVADGELKTGDAGNLHVKLLAKPYSMGSARAQGRNTINMMEVLRVIIKSDTDKQTFKANPNSLILMKVKALLGLV